MAWFAKNTSNWPTTFATLDEICVDGVKVEATGAFTANGEFYTAHVKKEFRSAAQAESWAQTLETQPKVTVKFDPNHPEEHLIEGLPA